MKQSPIQMVLEGVAAIFVVSTANARDLNYATSQSGGQAKQHGAVAPIPQYGAMLAPEGADSRDLQPETAHDFHVCDRVERA